MVAHGGADDFQSRCGRGRLTLDSDLTLIGRYESDATFTYLAVGGQMPTSALVDRLTLGGNNLASNILRSGRPDSISYEDASGPIATFARTLGIRSAVGTPIIVDGRIWGAMFACWTQLQKTPSRTVDRIAEITELVATAVANADSRTALVESRARVAKAGDDMRRQIERDLHDGAQQRLVALALKLRSYESTVPAELAELLAEVACGLDEVRVPELAHGIHPAVLSRGGLGPALKNLARRAPVPVEVNLQAPERLPEAIEAAAFYVVSESLANVGKYASANRARVDLARADGLLVVEVSDDGVGGADPSRGSGLVGLRDRVDTLGGTLTLSSPPSGTSLVVQLPMTSTMGQPRPSRDRNSVNSARRSCCDC